MIVEMMLSLLVLNLGPPVAGPAEPEAPGGTNEAAAP